MQKYSSTANWNNLYAQHNLAYPAEGVIRIFLGEFPKLKLNKDFSGKSILDMGFGDGRHFPLYQRLEMKISGVEISDKIVKATQQKEIFNDLTLDLRVGNNADIPFEDSAFDYLLSWNVAYYMGSENEAFSRHVSELNRVLKPSGYLIISVPTKDCFIYDSCEQTAPGYVKICNDYFGVRNGEIMRQFSCISELKQCFDEQFENFSCAEINMDWFGLNYSWHILICQKK